MLLGLARLPCGGIKAVKELFDKQHPCSRYSRDVSTGGIDTAEQYVVVTRLERFHVDSLGLDAGSTTKWDSR